MFLLTISILVHMLFIIKKGLALIMGANLLRSAFRKSPQSLSVAFPGKAKNALPACASIIGAALSAPVLSGLSSPASFALLRSPAGKVQPDDLAPVGCSLPDAPLVAVLPPVLGRGRSGSAARENAAEALASFVGSPKFWDLLLLIKYIN